MRLDRLTLRGIGPFREEVALDLATLPGPLVAICGDNGAGKTTLLEAFAGALHRRTPTRGTLADLATSRDAFVEVAIESDGTWTIRQTVDANTGKGEALVLGADGRPAIADGKVRSYDRWAAARLPAPEVLFASMFAAQQSSGFLGAGRAERMTILLRTLGIERYEALAEAARGRAKAARAAIAELEARIRDERARGADVEAAEQRLAAAREDAEASDIAASEAKAALDAARRRAEEARRARLAFDAAASERAAAQEQVARARAAHGELAAQQAAGAALRARAVQIREAATEAATLAEQIAALRTTLAQAEAEGAAARQEEARARRAAEAARRRAGDAAARRAELGQRLQRAREERERAARDIAEAQATLPEAEALFAQQDERARHAAAEAERLEGRVFLTAEARIERLRLALHKIAEGSGLSRRPAHAIARGALEKDDAEALASREGPPLLASARTTARSAHEAAAAARRRVEWAREAAAHDTADNDRSIRTLEEDIAALPKGDTAEAAAEDRARDEAAARAKAASDACHQARHDFLAIMERLSAAQTLAASADALARESKARKDRILKRPLPPCFLKL